MCGFCSVCFWSLDGVLKAYVARDLVGEVGNDCSYISSAGVNVDGDGVRWLVVWLLCWWPRAVRDGLAHLDLRDDGS